MMVFVFVWFQGPDGILITGGLECIYMHVDLLHVRLQPSYYLISWCFDIAMSHFCGFGLLGIFFSLLDCAQRGISSRVERIVLPQKFDFQSVKSFLGLELCLHSSGRKLMLANNAMSMSMCDDEMFILLHLSRFSIYLPTTPTYLICPPPPTLRHQPTQTSSHSHTSQSPQSPRPPHPHPSTKPAASSQTQLHRECPS